MRDVAERAGVSTSTVSHVINNTRFVASGTKERVLRVMSELRYYQNASARLLARGRSDSFGLLISDLQNPFFPELIKSFEATARSRGFDMLLCATNYDPAQARKAVRRMIENKVRGVAAMTSQLDPLLVQELIDSDIPVVVLDSGPVQRAKSNIRVDYSGGALEAVAHLQELGHRKIAILSGPQNRVSAVSYRNAVLEALARRGLVPLRVLEGNNQVGGGIEGARTLLRGPDLPTAILCGNDLAAIGVIQGVVEAGLRVPVDISVIGSDDISFAAYANPPMTTVRISRDELGRMAFEALEKTLRTRRRLPTESVLGTHLVVRQSTGPARPGTQGPRECDELASGIKRF